jgi:tetratricopeptide (TPR) repeat protein
MHNSRISALNIGTRGLVTLLVCATVVLSGCSEKRKVMNNIKESFSDKNYHETIIRCEHAIRHNIRTADVYYYYGLSLLEMGRDYESFTRFEDAVAQDSTFASRIAGRLLQAARQSLTKGDSRRAADRLKFATKLKVKLDMGPLRYLVADAYFEDRDFAAAAENYRVAVSQYPDTAAAEPAYFNMAECYVSLGDSLQAATVLEKELESFPKGPLAVRAGWRMVNLMYDQARSEFSRGNYENVVGQVTHLLELTTNSSLVQKSRFLLGETYERMGDYRSAYGEYKAIIDEDRGASGRIVERAKEKIDAFRDAGLL